MQLINYLNYKIKGGIQMFKLRKRLKEIDDIQNELKNKLLTEEKLYKFYLERKIDEINAKLKNKISYEIKSENKIKRDNANYIPLFYIPQKIINVKINEIELLRKKYDVWECENKISDYKTILNYLNKKSIGYFIKLDKKIEDLKKHNKELDDKKLNLEEELKKII